LSATDNNDDTDTRFQPPLDATKNKIQPIAEGYRLASTELVAPSLSVSLKQEPKKDRLKRDASSINSSTTATTTTTTTTITTTTSSVNIEQLTAAVSTNRSDLDDDLILNDANANAWAIGLLSVTADGSGESTYSSFLNFTETNKKPFNLFFFNSIFFSSRISLSLSIYLKKISSYCLCKREQKKQFLITLISVKDSRQMKKNKREQEKIERSTFTRCIAYL